MIYGLMADVHAHAWSQFSGLDEKGRNTRLMHIVSEIDRCCETVKREGGDTVRIAGDLFHVRGKVTPSVFNPIREVMRGWVLRGVTFQIVSGNHDLEGQHATDIGSAASMVGDDAIEVFNEWMDLGDAVMVPYVKGTQALLDTIETAVRDLHPAKPAEYDLIIHHGVDGTLTNMPPQGLTAEKLASFGFKRVFAGDFHHHKDFGNGVYSIGALTHQTWGDVDTKAGFLIVKHDEVKHYPSRAPRFIDLAKIPEDDLEDLPLMVDGHFVRAKLGSESMGDVAELRRTLEEAGAAGVLIENLPVSTAERREGVSAKSLSSIADSVVSYAEEKHSSAIAGLCLEILAGVTA